MIMSEVTRRELMPGVWLRSIHTGKFKSAYLSVTLLTPLEAETASENALIPAVLRQGTADHPDLESAWTRFAHTSSTAASSPCPPVALRAVS